MGDDQIDRDGTTPDRRRPWRKAAVGTAIVAVTAAAAGLAASESNGSGRADASAISISVAGRTSPPAHPTPTPTPTSTGTGTGSTGSPLGTPTGAQPGSAGLTPPQTLQQNSSSSGSGGSSSSGGSGSSGSGSNGSSGSKQAASTSAPPAQSQAALVPAPGPQNIAVEVTGQISCLSGKSVEGVWVQAAQGSGFASWRGIGAGPNSDYWFWLPTSESYSVHVGCGGTTASWAVAAISPTVSGTANSFYCDDNPDDSQYGTCVER